MNLKAKQFGLRSCFVVLAIVAIDIQVCRLCPLLSVNGYIWSVAGGVLGLYVGRRLARGVLEGACAIAGAVGAAIVAGANQDMLDKAAAFGVMLGVNLWLASIAMAPAEVRPRGLLLVSVVASLTTGVLAAVLVLAAILIEGDAEAEVAKGVAMVVVFAGGIIAGPYAVLGVLMYYLQRRRGTGGSVPCATGAPPV